jgi:hypothetical protein
MNNKPPYTITDKAADFLAKIVEAATRLELGAEFKRDIKLHRENRLRTIHSSLAIEGNSLSLDEVTAVIEGKLVAGKQTEIKEVKNAYEAYDKIMTFDPYSIEDFLKAHKLTTQGLVAEAGKFRGGDVGVFKDGAAVHGVFPKALGHGKGVKIRKQGGMFCHGRSFRGSPAMSPREMSVIPAPRIVSRASRPDPLGKSTALTASSTTKVLIPRAAASRAL